MDKSKLPHGLLIAIQAGKPSKKAVKSDSEDSDSEGSDKLGMQEAAMEDFIAAVHEKDTKAAMSALKDFLDMCDESSESDEEKASEEESK